MTSPEEWLSYADAPRIRVVPPGPKSKELIARQAAWESEAVVYPKYFPIAVQEARGATIEDVDGNRFIDWVSGVSVLNLGHRHPRLRAALDRQLDRIWHSLELPTEARVDFLRELRSVLPGTLRDHARVLFTVTGGDSVETAVNLADFVKKRHGVIAFSGSYHGVHGGAVNVTSGRKYRKTSSFHGGKVVRVPYPDPYRPVLDPDGGVEGTIRYLEHLLTDPYSGVDEVSSVLVEPILGEGGYVVPPTGFLAALREFCDRHDLLLIFDEIQTGLGRTGKWWACEHEGVTPDILCIAKTVGGGIPVSMVAYRDDLAPDLPAGFHLGTYRGNPLALAVGAESIRLLKEEDWIARASKRGAKLLRRFDELRSAHASIGQVRGRGFMIGVEFVRPGPAREPWGDRAKSMRTEMFQRGLLMHTCGPHDQVLRYIAPLVIEDELIDRGFAVFEEALTALDAGPEPTARALRVAVAPIAGPAPARGVRVPPPVHPMPAPPPPGRNLP